MISWPNSLIREIGSRRCIFFLGAGVSASARASDNSNPKDWEQFIRTSANRINEPKKKKFVDDFIKKKNYLLALQGIVSAIDPGDYHDLLNEHFNNASYEPGEIHKIINALDARIVITTNFDKIYENYCQQQSSEGYKIVCYDSKSLVDEIRSDTRLIIKAHGSINDIGSMIFTKSQYHSAKRNHPNFYEVLKALFITNTVLFIGCGFNDPDVCLLLEDVNIIGSSAKPHYALIKGGEHNQVAITDWKESYNITTFVYGTKHEDLTNELNYLLEQVESYRSQFRIP